MRFLGFGLILVFALAAFGLDVGESVRAGSLSVGSAHAKRHHRKHHKKRARHRHHKHHSAPATEMYRARRYCGVIFKLSKCSSASQSLKPK